MSSEQITRWRQLAGPTAVERVRSLPLAVWGMLMLIATEAALFAAFISSYFFLRWEGQAEGWPPAPLPDPKLLRPTVMLGVILLSSLTMLAAQVSIGRGRRGALAAWLAVTIALGLTFLGLQIWDWAEKVKDFTPQTDAHGSLVYLLQGGHVAHLVVGLGILLWVLVRALRGAYLAGRRVGITVTALYWHFVIAVGVAVYFTVVLSPRW